MATLGEFLAKNQDLLKPRAAAAPRGGFQDLISVTVILLSADQKTVTFGHLGRRFSVHPAAVVSIERSEKGLANPFNSGIVADIALKADATVTSRTTYGVRSLFSEGQPFA